MSALLARLGLSFEDTEDERAFANSFVRGRVLESQALLIGTAIFIYAFSLFDRMIDPVAWQATHLFRAFVMGPMLVAIALSFFTAFARRHFEALIVTGSVVTNIGVAIVYAVLDHGYQAAALGFALTLFGTTVFPVRSRYLLIASFLTLVIVGTGQTLSGNASPGWLLVNLMAVLCAFFLGTISAYLRERSARAAFLAQKELEQSRARIDDLLHSMLPRDIVARIQAGETTIADSHNEVSIVFADLIGFTALSRKVSPTQLVEMLNGLFSTFDLEAERYGIERIKTIGDTYMAVGGLTRVPGKDHAESAAEFAFAMLRAVEQVLDRHGYAIQVRIGLHIGPVVAGVIGLRRPAFDCWGDAVNLASRLEGRAPAGSILISESAYWRLRPLYEIETEGDVELKNMGSAKVYRLKSRRLQPAPEADGATDLETVAWNRI